jgi:hypothetical protein
VRAARPEESDAVYDFYNTHKDPNVLPRPEADFRRSAEKGLFFIGMENNQAVAVAGVFDLDDPGYVELGGTLIDPSTRGFGLQNLLFRIRIASVLLHQDLNTVMMTAIDPKNTRSAANAMKSGFSPWSNPVTAVFAPCVSCSKEPQAKSSGRRCCCDFYLLPEPNIVSAVDQLLKEFSSSATVVYYSNYTPQTLDVSLHSIIMTPLYRQILADYISGIRW